MTCSEHPSKLNGNNIVQVLPYNTLRTFVAECTRPLLKLLLVLEISEKSIIFKLDRKE